MATDLELIGDDVSTVTPDGRIDLDLTFTPITGSRVVAEGVLRRWTTPRGTMFWAPDAGVDLLGLVNSDLERWQVEVLKMVLGREARQVDGCKSCLVTVVQDPATRTLSVRGDIETEAGSSALLVDIGDAAQVLSAKVL